tara:strand:- start:8808 stop:9437 length:630 start_codon:yes stop_codon:yes gene_type:complete
MNLETALEDLEAQANPARAEEMRAYHKADRRYLGLTNPQIAELAQTWRDALDVEGRVALADTLWQSDIFEARVAAAKLLTQARLRPDDQAAWALIASWTADFDSWAIADHASMAAQKRLVADPTRLDEVEPPIISGRGGRLWSRPCRGPNRTTPNQKSLPRGTASLAGPRRWCRITVGSSKRRSVGGCATCRNTIPSAPAPLSPPMGRR